MGAVKGEGEEVPQPTGEHGEAQIQPEANVDVDQAQAAFENVSVGEVGDENGAKASRWVETVARKLPLPEYLSSWTSDHWLTHEID